MFQNLRLLFAKTKFSLHQFFFQFQVNQFFFAYPTFMSQVKLVYP